MGLCACAGSQMTPTQPAPSQAATDVVRQCAAAGVSRALHENMLVNPNPGPLDPSTPLQMAYVLTQQCLEGSGSGASAQDAVNAFLAGQ